MKNHKDADVLSLMKKVTRRVDKEIASRKTRQGVNFAQECGNCPANKRCVAANNMAKAVAADYLSPEGYCGKRMDEFEAESAYLQEQERKEDANRLVIEADVLNKKS